MIVHDLSHAVGDGMRLYPGDPAPRVRRLSSIDAGDALTVSSLELPCHAGTHVDAPAHFLAGGRMLSDYPAEAYVGPAVVVDLASETHVTAEALLRLALPSGRHVLLRTRNSARPAPGEYDPDHAIVEPEAAEVLIASAPRSIGFDDYSVDAFGDRGLAVHRRLAAAGLLVYVELDLATVPAGEYLFCGLPPRIENVEAAPVRALVWRP